MYLHENAGKNIDKLCFQIPIQMVYNFLPYNLKRPVDITDHPPPPKEKGKNKKEKKYLIYLQQ